MQVANAINIADLALLAKARLPKVIFDFVDGGAEDERTLRANCTGFDRYRLRPRVLSGHAKRDLSITLFGQKLAAPFMIGPTGLNGIHWTDGDLHLSRAASKAGIGFTLSTASNNSIEQVGADSAGVKFFQLYPWGDHSVTGRLIDRAAAAGYKAMMVTVDSLTPGKRERDLRNHFAHEVHITPRVVWDGLTHPRWLVSTWLARGMPRTENVAEFAAPGANAHALAKFTRSQRNPHLDWEDMAWARARWPGPFLIKGILTAEDALIARQMGADGVVVSNHGGRALDCAPASIEALPGIAAAVGDSMTVLVDGGFRRGSDIVKALALGAKGVLLGRATLFGLAAGGEPGVARAIAILRDEVDRVFALIGCGAVSDVTPGHVAAVEEFFRHDGLVAGN
ncbi:MAG: alpha-hydroxy-acid oxidizing protein [Betaproteobacteria bacterium]|nr:alpha-hydroxy-acid oxidizing protein [Betaproteobacteria bacterium]